MAAIYTPEGRLFAHFSRSVAGAAAPTRRLRPVPRRRPVLARAARSSPRARLPHRPHPSTTMPCLPPSRARSSSSGPNQGAETPLDPWQVGRSKVVADRLQERHVRQRQLDLGAGAPHHSCAQVGGAPGKLAGEAGLPHAGVPDEEDEPAVVRTRRGQGMDECRQLVVPTDQYRAASLFQPRSLRGQYSGSLSRRPRVRRSGSAAPALALREPACGGRRQRRSGRPGGRSRSAPAPTPLPRGKTRRCSARR